MTKNSKAIVTISLILQSVTQKILKKTGVNFISLTHSYVTLTPKKGSIFALSNLFTNKKNKEDENENEKFSNWSCNSIGCFNYRV